MSRAFVKESDGAEGQELPELRISPHRNLVTPDGKRQIEATVEQLQSALSAARTTADRAAIARLQRDLRYWNARLHTAEVVPASAAAGQVRFGCTVVLKRQDGQLAEFRIVGEDEADPAHGRISYVSPIARSLIGSSVGDTIALADGNAEILQIR